MCLDKITKRHKLSLFNLWIPKLAYKSGYGWKWFQIDKDSNICSWLFESENELPINRFIDEAEYRGFGTKPDYGFGWHIFLEKPPDYYSEGWPRHITKRVKYKIGHVEGKWQVQDFEGSVIAAKYMKILPQ